VRHRSSIHEEITRTPLVPILLAAPIALALAGCSPRRTEEPPAGPALVASPAAEGCPHPFLPLIQGAGWVYEVGATEGETQPAELLVTHIEKQGAAIKAQVKRTLGQSETTVEAVCNEDGTSFLAFFVPLGPPVPVSLNYTPRITQRIGALLPPASQLKTGAAWTYDLVAHTEQPAGKTLTMDSAWQAKIAYAGDRVVVVPAGRYDVKQLTVELTGHHRPPDEEDIVFSDRVMDPPVMSYTYSLARGVGVVLIEGELADGEHTRRARWALKALIRP
jgi:hypothetical protein